MHIPQRVSRGLAIAIVGILCISMLAPAAALADTDLVIGGSARIAYANGDDVRLREEPGYDATVLALIPEGTILTVLDGPVEASDGSLWYQITVNDQTGYMVSDYLALLTDDQPVAEPAPEVVEPEPEPEAEPAAPAAEPAAVVGVAMIAGTNGDGVRCRIDASTSAATITVLPEGAEVELTGDVGDVWQPVNCAGRAGFVHSDFVSYDGGAPAVDSGAEEPAADQNAEPEAEEAAEPEESTFEASAAVTGSAVVAGTNGDGVRCRSGAGYDKSTITVLAEGTTVNLRGSARGEWQPVLCAGRNGYAHIDYLAIGGSSDNGGDEAEEDESAPEAAAATGSARVAGTNGGGLNCRSSATMSNNVITTLAEGSTVELRGSARGEWQPVICAGRNGYAHVDYLSFTDSGGSDDGGSSGDGGGGENIVVTGQARVTNAAGGLRCRNGAGLDKNVITVLPNGSTVDLRAPVRSEWAAVVCAGRKGYVHADYISVGGSDGGGGDSGGGGGGGSNSGLTAGQLAMVSGTNGDGVRMRSGPSTGSSTITVLREGTVVDVRSGSEGDWVAISYNGSNGFSHMDYLVATDGNSGGGDSGGGDSGGDSGGGGGYRLSTGDHAQATANLNLRYEPNSSSGVAAVAPAGTVVEITGAPSGPYYPVNWDGLSGFMHTDYLSSTNAALSERGGSGAPNPGGGGGDGGNGSADGNAMVDFAMQYLGYPYVWATAGPGSFDCSGFTYWVTLNVLGIDIGRGTFTQAASGTPVSRSNLQPGDLVFFQNTYTWGLSHVGLYIGGGQFIHAENASTGVRISDLSSSYYSSRWYGAVRLT